MKVLLKIFFPALLIAFISCDKVDMPIVKRNVVQGSSFVEKNNSTVSGFKKIMLEDYTGMRCPNCPDAAVAATNLLSQYTSSLVVVAVHAGMFAIPFGNYKTQEYRSDAGDVWNGTTGFNIPGYPNGMINRTNYASTGTVVLNTSWPSIVSEAAKDPFIIKLNVTTKYDTTTGSLNVFTKGYFNQAYPDNVNLCVIVTEDGIAGKQDVHGVEKEYEFEHMMRGSLNGPWGEAFKSGPAAAKDSVNHSITNFNLKGIVYNVASPPSVKPITVNDRNISVVVFAFNQTTRQVLQVEKVKIR
jgi:hypothetical protein